jgi:hypothetical protein
MPYVSCKHAMPHFEIFDEHNDVVLPGFFTTEQEALAFLLDSANDFAHLYDAKVFHIGHACLEHNEWEHGTCIVHQVKLSPDYSQR